QTGENSPSDRTPKLGKIHPAIALPNWGKFTQRSHSQTGENSPSDRTFQSPYPKGRGVWGEGFLLHFPPSK
ncbi:MAG: hypothetical protein KFF72_11130, partial [Arthrospira sp. SH-MAG29]